MILVPRLIPKSSLKIIKKTGSNTKNLFQDSFDIHIKFKIFESSLGWRQSKPQDSRPRILGEAIHLLKPRIEILSQLDFLRKNSFAFLTRLKIRLSESSYLSSTWLRFQNIGFLPYSILHPVFRLSDKN